MAIDFDAIQTVSWPELVKILKVGIAKGAIYDSIKMPDGRSIDRPDMDQMRRMLKYALEMEQIESLEGEGYSSCMAVGKFERP